MSKRLLVCLIALLIAISLLAGCKQRTDDASGERLLILYAFSAEGELLSEQMTIDTVEIHLGREVQVGRSAGHEIVLAASGVGMTNAAMTTQRMIDVYDPRAVIFTGIAGGIDSSVHIGDIVVAERWRQHDYGYIGADGFVHGSIWVYVPTDDSLLRVTDFFVDKGMLDVAGAVDVGDLTLESIGERKPRLMVGGVGVSGNTFIDSKDKRAELSTVHEALVVDMESAAVAQVCAVNATPFIAFRSASDLAGGSGSETAGEELDQFFKVAASNSAQVVVAFLDRW